jgi:hypothetical protein
VVMMMTFAQTTVLNNVDELNTFVMQIHLLPDAHQTTGFMMLVHWVYNPVDSGIMTNLESSRV